MRFLVVVESVSGRRSICLRTDMSFGMDRFRISGVESDMNTALFCMVVVVVLSLFG